jgi:cell division septation protein DedD
VPDKRVSSLRTILIALSLSLGLASCDMVQQKMGIEDQTAKAAQNDADGKAVGGACRQSGRAIEDCYSIYSWLPKASIYEGWRDMDAYMRENKLDTVEPQLPPVAAPVSAAAAAAAAKKKKAPAAAAEEPSASDKTVKKAEEKH